ncbi:MAG: chromosome segregation protein SMC, partial [Gammaproteobacteria bacterium]
AQEVLRRDQAELATLEARLAQGHRRREELEVEVATLQSQLQQDQGALEEAVRLLEEARQEYSDLALRRQALEAERDRLQRALQQARENWQQCQTESHRLALERQSLESRQETLDRTLERNRRLLEQLEERCRQLREGAEQAGAPIPGMEQRLRELLEERLESEQLLNAAREEVQSLDNRLREIEQNRSAVDQRIQECRDRLEQARVAQREVEVEIESLRRQLAKTDFDPAELLAELQRREPAPDEEGLAAAIEAVERRIQRLGPINLAAIEEYRQESERKEYIDAQHADLTEALETLERAIQKIDRETRSRFKETFDRVNSGLQSLFPRLFGGGHAYLELTSDDLLEAGVTVMARPPGKRNSTIHLLSGGEKALTAVAFVFAIFKLNPAPFCIMDEVDAPLDDANVGRLCDIVRAMSDEIQFVIITHNKITMEMAGHLIGVTMQEAGVSRLVAVDMERAMKMAVNA